ncbi:helix-turn-helix domain-containing protein [Gemmiger sp.]
MEELINYKEIGNRIRERRVQVGWTQEMLAEQIDVATVYVSRIENGKAQVNLKRLAELAQVLKTPIEYFISGTVRSHDYQIDEIHDLIENFSPQQREHVITILQEMKKML